ncbi:MAG: hypothetical protein WBE13_11875 [Candidatus Acidiferrum sp.]
MTDLPNLPPNTPSAAPSPDKDIHYLILKAEHFIVFLDSDLDVDWETSDEYDQIGPKDSPQQNDILNRAASLECTPNDQHKRSIRLNFKRMIGEAIARSLHGDYENAKKMLEQARLYIADRNVEKARYWQLLTACVLGLVAGLAGVIMWAVRSYLSQLLGESAYFLALAAVAGSLGAVLSMIFRMGRSFPTSEAPRALHILEATSRMAAGCLSGLLVAGAVGIGLILPAFKTGVQSHLAMLLAGMVGGASERWAPSLIARFEGTQEKLAVKGQKS